MHTIAVPQSTATNMIGPYLAAEAVCPFCRCNNILLHLEGPMSPVKVDRELICGHLKARFFDDDDQPFFEFKGEELPATQPAG